MEEQLLKLRKVEEKFRNLNQLNNSLEKNFDMNKFSSNSGNLLCWNALVTNHPNLSKKRHSHKLESK